MSNGTFCRSRKHLPGPGEERPSQQLLLFCAGGWQLINSRDTFRPPAFLRQDFDLPAAKLYPVGTAIFLQPVRGAGPVRKNTAGCRQGGAAVRILGTNLAGAISVTFNGMAAATLTINSTGTAISTTVPAGATTGAVEVVTPSGMLSSPVPFLVLP